MIKEVQYCIVFVRIIHTRTHTHIQNHFPSLSPLFFFRFYCLDSLLEDYLKNIIALSTFRKLNLIMHKAIDLVFAEIITILRHGGK